MTDSFNRIALFGTSADPPTKGHQYLLEGLLTIFPKVVTWASNNPMKSHKLSLEKRQNLLGILVNSIDNNNLELAQDLSSPWTIETIAEASKKWPNSHFTFVIGSDLITQILTWKNVKRLLQTTYIGVAPRQGWPLRKDDINKIESLGGKIHLLPLNIPLTASSEIRDNTSVSNIPDCIMDAIVKENLYEINSWFNKK